MKSKNKKNRQKREKRPIVRKILTGLAAIKMATISMAAAQAPMPTSSKTSAKGTTAKVGEADNAKTNGMLLDEIAKNTQQNKQIQNIEIKQGGNTQEIQGLESSDNAQNVRLSSVEATDKSQNRQLGQKATKVNLNKEITDRENAIQSEVAARDSAIEVEKNRAIQKEGELSKSLSNYEGQQKTKDETQDRSISNLEDRTRIQGTKTTSNTQKINQEKSAREDAIQNEETARDNAIGVEATRATNKEQQIARNLNKEVSSRTSGDKAISDRITAYQKTQEQTDQNQDSQISDLGAQNKEMQTKVSQATSLSNDAKTAADRATSAAGVATSSAKIATNAANAAKVATDNVNDKLTTMIGRTSQVPVNQANIEKLQEEIGLTDANGNIISSNPAKSHEARITKLEATDQTQEQQIGTIQTKQNAIENKLGGIDQNAKDIKVLQADLAPLKPQEIAAMGQEIKDNKEDISKVESLLTTGTSQATGRYSTPGKFAKDIDTLSQYDSKLDDLSGRLQSNTGQIGVNKANANQALQQSSNALNTANTAKNEADLNTQRLSTVEGDTRTNTDNILRNNNNIDDLKSMFTTTGTEASEASRVANENKGNLDDLKSRVTKDEADLKTVTDNTGGIVRTKEPRGNKVGETTIADKVIAEQGVEVTGGTTTDTLDVTGDTNLKDTNIEGSLDVGGDTNLKNTNIDGTLTATGEIQGNDGLTINRGITNLKDTSVTGDLIVNGKNIETTINTVKTGLEGDLNAETTRATAAEQKNSQQIVANKATTDDQIKKVISNQDTTDQKQDNAIKDNVDVILANKGVQQVKDNTQDTRLDDLETSKVNQGQNIVANADNISKEETRATTREGELNTAIGNNKQGITDERARAVGEETKLQGNIDKETQAREGALTAEATARSKAIGDERIRATGVENGLRSDLTSESTVARNEEQVNAQNIVGEQSRATTAEQKNADDLTTFKTSQSKVDGTQNTRLDDLETSKVNQGQDIVANADNTSKEEIRATTKEGELSTEIGNNKQGITDEKVRAVGEETKLQGNIDKETQAREGALTAEATARSKAVGDERVRATGVENGLRSDLTNESTMARNAEQVNAQNIVGEQSRAITAEQKNADDIQSNKVATDNKIQKVVSNQEQIDQKQDNAIKGNADAIVSNKGVQKLKDDSQDTKIQGNRDLIDGLATSGITASTMGHISSSHGENGKTTTKFDNNIETGGTLTSGGDITSGGKISSSGDITSGGDVYVTRSGGATTKVAGEDQLKKLAGGELSEIDDTSGSIHTNKKLTEDLSDETTRATTLEGNLQTNIETEKIARITAIAREKSERNQAIQGEKQARTTMVNSETSRATGVESGLRNDLTSESTRATTAEQKNSDDLIAFGIKQKLTDRNQDGRLDGLETLTTNQGQKITKNTDEITQEKSRATIKEGQLKSDIDKNSQDIVNLVGSTGTVGKLGNVGNIKGSGVGVKDTTVFDNNLETKGKLGVDGGIEISKVNSDGKYIDAQGNIVNSSGASKINVGQELAKNQGELDSIKAIKGDANTQQLQGGARGSVGESLVTQVNTVLGTDGTFISGNKVGTGKTDGTGLKGRIATNEGNIAELAQNTGGMRTSNGTTTTATNFATQSGKNITSGGDLLVTRIGNQVDPQTGKVIASPTSQTISAADESQLLALAGAGVTMNNHTLVGLSDIAGDTSGNIMTNRALTESVNKNIGTFGYNSGQMTSTGDSFGSVNQAFNDVNKNLAGIKTLDAKQDTHLGQIDNTIKQFGADIETNAENIDKLNTRVDEISDDVGELQKEVGLEVSTKNLKSTKLVSSERPIQKEVAPNIQESSGADDYPLSKNPTSALTKTGKGIEKQTKIVAPSFSKQGYKVESTGLAHSVETNYNNTKINQASIGDTKKLHENLKDGEKSNTVAAINKIDDKVDANSQKITETRTAIDKNNAVLANRSARNAAAIQDVGQEVQKNTAKINQVRGEERKGISDSAALGSIKYPSLEKGEAAVGAGYGGYKGESSIAIGMGVQATDNLFINTSASASSGSDSEVLIGAGATYKFKFF